MKYPRFSNVKKELPEVIGGDERRTQSGDGSAYTWLGLKPDSSFWPGRLDLVSTTGFGTVTGRVFDTGRIWDTGLQQLGVAGEDRAASDHLMVVVDLEFDE